MGEQTPIELFADFLSKITDEDERKRAMRQAGMLAMNSADVKVFEPPIRTLGQYLADPIEVPPVLINPYIVVRGGVTVTIGRAGKGKTVMNLNRIFKWAAGRPMFETWKNQEGDPLLAPVDIVPKILVIENEGAAGLFHRQLGIMRAAEGYLTDEDRKAIDENILIWGEGGYSGLKLDDPEKVRLVREGVAKWKPDIVFIEPFRGLWSGEENSATDMTKAIDAMLEIAADYNCGIMLAHHEKKGGAGEDDKMSAARGSTVLEGAVTVMENFESIKGGEQRELSWSKSRHDKAPHPVRMEWDADAWWYKHVPYSDLEEAILAELGDNSDEPMTVKDFVERLDEKEHTVRGALKKLKGDNRVKAMSSVSDGRGSSGARYRLPVDEQTSGGGLSVT